MSAQGYVVHVNAERTVMVRAWDSGRMEVALRSEPDAIWGPPIRVEPEPQYDATADGGAR
jgi:hypothetical protein